jgi:H+/Cl- antiporter ClcA
MDRLGKLIVIAGLVIVTVGIIIWLFGDKLRFLGRLPGDIRYSNDNVKVFFPITTMILISILLSIILWIVQKFK